MDAFVRRRMHERPLSAEFGLAPGLAHGGGSSRRRRRHRASASSPARSSVDVVPRLSLSRRTPSRSATAATVPTPAEIRAFTALAWTQDAPALRSPTSMQCARAASRSKPSPSICWRRPPACSATCGPTTMRLRRSHHRRWRLQQALVALHRGIPAPSGNRPRTAACMLLAPCPGEQHVFGAVDGRAEFFRRDGWNV